MRVGGRVWLSILLIGFLACLAVLSSFVPAGADVYISPWLSTNPPALDKLKELGPTDPLTLSITTNRDCQERTVITRPKRYLPIPQTQQSHASCVVDTAYGAFSTSNTLQRAGTSVAGNLKSSTGGSVNHIPIPHSSTGITMAGGTQYGDNVFFWDNLDQTLSTTAIFDGSVNHRLPASSPTSLKDKSGKLLSAEPDSISFSANGDWMVADIPFVATVRINTKTREVLPFSSSVSYSIGVGPAFRTAISPDGRYATVASYNFGFFRLYDLSTCGAVPDVITAKVSCDSIDLWAQMKQQIPNFHNVTSVRFKNNYTLDMYLGTKLGTTSKIIHYTLTADGQQPATYDYLALGDSFASGEGAYQYKALTDTTENKCHLSQRSYPYLISNALSYGQHESIACSGAVIDDLLRIDDGYKGQAKDDITKGDRNVEKILTVLNPGYIAQKEFIDRYQPNVITVSVVGNDIGFADKIIRCLDTDTCYGSYEDRLEIIQEVNEQFPRLVDMYTQLKVSGNPRAKIYVVGYPQIGYPDGICAENVHLNRAEMLFANQLVSYLNSVIKTAAENAGVAYVDVEDAFAGYRFCETDSWNVAINGLTIGNDIVNLPFIHGPIGNESFHPNAFGHQLLKIKILEQTSNFTLEMPIPKPSILLGESPDSLPFLDAPKANRIIRRIKNTTGTNGGVIEIGKSWVTQYSGLAPFIKAGTAVQAWLNSTPVNLGTFTTDTAGNLTLELTLPDSVPSGFHTLHLYGKNASFEDIDFYETVYVSNGNSSPCAVVEPSGQDTDKDAIEDSCDPLIDQPPLVVEPEEPEPSIETENPPAELPAEDPSEEPQQEIAQNPKPPENNPETVAGSGQPAPPAILQPAILVSTTQQAPINTSILSNNSDIPQVQGSNTIPQSIKQLASNSSPTANPAKPPTPTKLTLPIAVLSTITLLITLTILKKRKKTP